MSVTYKFYKIWNKEIKQYENAMIGAGTKFTNGRIIMIKSISEVIPTTSIRIPPIPPTGGGYNYSTSHQCDSCVKSDVCSIKDELMNELERKEVFF